MYHELEDRRARGRNAHYIAVAYPILARYYYERPFSSPIRNARPSLKELPMNIEVRITARACGAVGLALLLAGILSCGSGSENATLTAPDDGNATNNSTVDASISTGTDGGINPSDSSVVSGVNKARPFAATSPFNTPTPSSTEWYDSPLLHTWAAPSGQDNFRHWWVAVDYGIAWVSDSEPQWTFNLPGYTANDWHRTRPATTLTFRANASLTPQPAVNPGDDRYILVADPATGDYVEVWSSTVDAAAHTVTGPVWATGNMITGLGVGDLATNLNAGVRAANFSVSAGAITKADIDAGKIDHALEVNVPGNMLLGGASPVGPYIPPATAGNGDWPTGTIKMGSKIGIPASATRPNGLSPLGNLVFDALQKYGMYVGDVCGGQWPIFAADGPSFGIKPGASLDNTPFEPLIAFWNHAGSADMEKIGPLLRVADYQP